MILQRLPTDASAVDNQAPIQNYTMLIVLAERLAQILEWLKNVAGYRIIETNWRVLGVTNQHQRQISHRRASSLPTADVLLPHLALANWITSKDNVSFVWLTSLSTISKEDLCRTLVAINGQDVFVMGISYSDSQSLTSSCRAALSNNNNFQTLPRCKSYRLSKSFLPTNPQDTLSSIVARTGQRRTLFFSRHGESEYNVLGKVGGDANLSARGYEYADCLADYVNKTLSETPGFRIWTSCLKRTIQTARLVKAPQEHLAALNELDTGVCDGMTYEEIAERYPIEFAARDEDKFLYRYPGGESYCDLLERVEPVLNRLRTEDNVMVVAHQAVLRCLLGALLDKDSAELPYIHAPLHTVIRLSFTAGDSQMDFIPLDVECVDTHRKKPENCSNSRSTEEALVTVPAHF